MAALARGVLALLFIWLLGALLLGALGLRQRRRPLGWAQPGIDFAAGVGLLGMLWPAVTLAGWRVTPALLYLLAFVLAIPGAVRLRRRPVYHDPGPEDMPSAPRWSSWFLALACAVILLTIAGVAVRSYTTGLFWDGRYIWGFKAKALFVDGSIDRETFSNIARYRYTHVDYPPAVPAAETWVYQVVGRVDERLAKWVGITFWLATAVLLASYLRRGLARPWALLVTSVVMQIPVFTYHAGGGGADVPQGFYLLVAGVLAADWLERGRREDSMLAALMLGMGALVKAEGTTMALGGALIFAVACLARGRPIKAGGLLALPTLVLPSLPWLLLRAAWHIPSLQLARPEGRTSAEVAMRLQAVGTAIASTAVNWQQWEAVWVWVLLGLAAYLMGGRREGYLAALWGLLAWQAGVLVAVYAVSPYDIQWHLSTSLDRVLLQLMPLGVAAAGASLAVGRRREREVSSRRSVAPEIAEPPATTPAPEEGPSDGLTMERIK